MAFLLKEFGSRLLNSECTLFTNKINVMVTKDTLVTSSQVITSPFTHISTNMKNLLNIIIPGLLLFLTLGVNTSFAQNCGPGRHWVDNCQGGVDIIMRSGALAGISLNPSSCERTL